MKIISKRDEVFSSLISILHVLEKKFRKGEWRRIWLFWGTWRCLHSTLNKQENTTNMWTIIKPTQHNQHQWHKRLESSWGVSNNTIKCYRARCNTSIPKVIIIIKKHKTQAWLSYALIDQYAQWSTQKDSCAHMMKSTIVTRAQQNHSKPSTPVRNNNQWINIYMAQK